MASSARVAPTPLHVSTILQRPQQRVLVPRAASLQPQQQQAARPGVLAAASRKRQQQQPEPAGQWEPAAKLPQGATPGAAPEPDRIDIWEGEGFEVLGQLSSQLIPLVAFLALLIGLFAASTFDEGATVFLNTPKGPEDTVELIPAQQLQQE